MFESSGKPSSAPLAYRMAARAKPALVRRWVTSARIWSRHTLSRDSLISSFKTFLWVVPLTLIIWIYAEREQLAPAPNVPIKIEPQNSDPNRVVTFADNNIRTTITADLAGPHGRLEQVQRQLESSLSLRLDIDPRLENGTHRISTRALGNDQLFVTNGISVRNIVPEEVTIRIDAVETREVAVQPPADNSNRLVSFSSDPRTVRVSGPQSFFREHPNLGVWADVALNMPGRHEEKVNLNLNLPPLTPARFVTITPSTATAKYEVRQADSRYTVPSMPVWVTYSSSPDWHKYMADYQSTISDVTVIGPEEVISRLKNDPDFPKPHAYFEVESGKTTTNAPIDFNRLDQEYQAPLHYALSDGLRVDEKAASAMIRFKIKPLTPE